MEIERSFVLKLSLEEMALRRVVISLWNDSDILASITTFDSDEDDEFDTMNIDKIKDKVSKLVLPELLKKQMIRVVKPIGLQMIGWKVFYEKNINREILDNEGDISDDGNDMTIDFDAIKSQNIDFEAMKSQNKNLDATKSKSKDSGTIRNQNINFDVIRNQDKNFDSIKSQNKEVNGLKQLYWTSVGSLDYQKTVEALIRSEMFGVKRRYILACVYCLVDYIPDLWEKLPEKIKMHFYDKEYPSPLESYWATTLHEEESKLDCIIGIECSSLSFYQRAFEFSACSLKKAATQYFYQKLTETERESSLFRTACNVCRKARFYRRHIVLSTSDDFPELTDVLCYLLSLLRPEQQMQVLQQNACGVLKSILRWPWQDLASSIGEDVWKYVSEKEWNPLSSHILDSINTSGYYFPIFFQKFFVHCSSKFRKDFFKHAYGFVEFFHRFCEVEDTESIEVVFRNLDAEDRVRLVSSERFFRYFLDHLVMEERWDLVEFCLRELSKEDRERLKMAFTGNRLTSSKIQKCDRLFKLFDETDKSDPTKK